MNKYIKKVLKEFNENGETSAKKEFEDILKNKHLNMLFREDFYIHRKNNRYANTLPKRCVGKCVEGKFTLYAEIQEDYYKWVNFFIVVFDDNKNFIIGDFEKTVIASNKKHLDIFLKYYQPEKWDYNDI